MEFKNEFELKILRELIRRNDDKITSFGMLVNILFGDMTFLFFGAEITAVPTKAAELFPLV